MLATKLNFTTGPAKAVMQIAKLVIVDLSDLAGNLPVGPIAPDAHSVLQTTLFKSNGCIKAFFTGAVVTQAVVKRRAVGAKFAISRWLKKY